MQGYILSIINFFPNSFPQILLFIPFYVHQTFRICLNRLVFESCFDLFAGNFFQNIGSIMVFAILGTAISALIVGGGRLVRPTAPLLWAEVGWCGHQRPHYGRR